MKIILRRYLWQFHYFHGKPMPVCCLQENPKSSINNSNNRKLIHCKWWILTHCLKFQTQREKCLFRHKMLNSREPFFFFLHLFCLYLVEIAYFWQPVSCYYCTAAHRVPTEIPVMAIFVQKYLQSAWITHREDINITTYFISREAIYPKLIWNFAPELRTDSWNHPPTITHKKHLFFERWKKDNLSFL